MQKNKKSIKQNNNILERIEVSEVYTDSQFSEMDKEDLELNSSIFFIFDEVRIQGDGNRLFRSLSWCF